MTHDKIGWQFHERWTWSAEHCDTVCVLDEVWDQLRIRRTHRELCVWLYQRYRVEILESALVGIVCFGGSRKDQQWPSVGSCMWYLLHQSFSNLSRRKRRQHVTYTSIGVNYAWTTNTYAHPWLPSQVSVGSGCIDRGLFIAKTDEPHAKVHALLTNVNHWKAG